MKVRSISFTSKYKVGTLHWIDIQGVESEDKGEGIQKRKMRTSFTMFFRPLRVSRKLFYCCPLNFKTTHFPYPQRPSIGVADSFFEK